MIFYVLIHNIIDNKFGNTKNPKQIRLAHLSLVKRNAINQYMYRSIPLYRSCDLTFSLIQELSNESEYKLIDDGNGSYGQRCKYLNMEMI